MNHKNYRTLNEFVQRYIVHNQTYLVDNILKDDKLLKHYNNLHNDHYFKEQLSDGLFIGSIDNLSRKQEEIYAKIEILTDLIGSGKFEPLKELASLKNDIEILDNAEPISKEPLEWWLVPYWLAERLKERDEIILRIYACNWWGRSDITKPLNKEAVLFSICQKMGLLYHQ